METLRQRLTALEGKGYKAYKCLEGSYRFPGFTLRIDHVQGDPYADASRIRVQLTAASAALEQVDLHTMRRRIALEDFLGRAVAGAIDRRVKGRRGTGRSGQITIAGYGQQILVRNAVLVTNEGIEVRMRCALPADGRSIRAHDAAEMLLQELPAVVADALVLNHLPLDNLNAHLDCAEDQGALRDWLEHEGLVAFVADGALLPRRSGVDDRPLEESAIPFRSPETLRRSVTLPHAGQITGMGVPTGVTLIVGGGFHGKSTLLRALERGVYDHIPGDGRERVASLPDAVKIRAEDGRAVASVDISPFINHLPFGRDTQRFTTDNASGSTSQAANIVEALSCGCRLMLVDEDTSATNFMIRDRRMQALVSREKEPITPLVQRVRELYDNLGVSSVIVMGGTGEFFAVADTVVMMDHYQPSDVSAPAKDLAGDEWHRREAPTTPPLGTGGRRCVSEALPQALGAIRQIEQSRLKIQARGRRLLRCGDAEIDLAQVEQFVDDGQLLAVGFLLQRLAQSSACGAIDIVHDAETLLAEAARQGLDQLTPYVQGELALPRLYELLAAINRLRNLQVEAPRDAGSA